jgi:foldase protein PrsA
MSLVANFGGGCKRNRHRAMNRFTAAAPVLRSGLGDRSFEASQPGPFLSSLDSLFSHSDTSRSDVLPSVRCEETPLRKKLAAMCVTAACAGPALLPGCHSSAPPAPAPAPAPRVEAPRPFEPMPPAPTTQVVEPSKAASYGSEIIALANGIPITRQQLEQPLIEAYGLGILLNLVQLELARQQAERLNVHISPEDVRAERERTFAKMFTTAQKSDYEQFLDQFLRQQHLSRAEFDLVVEVNAYLRKVSQIQVAGKFGEEELRSAFSQLYGENRQVRDIVLSNIREVAEAKQRLAKGEPFEQVAREMSQDPRSAALGGELPPFSAQSPNMPDVIKNSAFTLKVDGESDALVDGSTYHLIKLIRVIPPKIVKYEDVKDSVRQTVEDEWIEKLAMPGYRNQLAQLALQTMQINDPVLREQWNQKLEQQRSAIRDRDSALQKMNQDRQNAATQPAASGPTESIPASPPAAAGQSPAVERPPATMPGASAPGSSPVPAPTTQP